MTHSYRSFHIRISTKKFPKAQIDISKDKKVFFPLKVDYFAKSIYFIK